MKNSFEGYRRPDLAEELNQIIRHRLVSIQFQPIVHLGKNAIGGYEALSRGPSDSVLHSPLVLFEAAANAGLIVERELMVLQKIVQRKPSLVQQRQQLITYDTTVGYMLLSM